MLKRLQHRLARHPNETIRLVYRLLTENGALYWKHYAATGVLMAIGAGGTAGVAYLIGTAANQVYSARDFYGIVAVALAVIAMFTIKGWCTYGQAVILARIGNRI